MSVYQEEAVINSHTFYRATGKRLFDLVMSLAGLLVLTPLLALIALVAKCSSPGPVLFSQRRIGLDGKEFFIWKFRTMRHQPQSDGPVITAAGDPRVTSIGKILRGCKLDELPQLWNVMRGEMSFVGPRPELPLYVSGYTAAQREVLTVRPGITDPASLIYRHEEKLLATAKDPEVFYREVVLPDKLRLNLEYVQKISFFYDLKLIVSTLGVLPRPKAVTSSLEISRNQASKGAG